MKTLLIILLLLPLVPACGADDQVCRCPVGSICLYGEEAKTGEPECSKETAGQYWQEEEMVCLRTAAGYRWVKFDWKGGK